MADPEKFYRAAEHRIEYLTLGCGLIAALGAGVRWGWPYALGTLVGAVLAWVNYRWLKQGLHMLAGLASTQPDPEKVRIPKSVYVKFFARYALIVIVIYVIFSRSWLPAAAVLGGLFALAGAAICEILYQLARSKEQEEV